MEVGENNKIFCQKCGEIYKILRLFFRKRAKKCFLRFKKKFQEGNINIVNSWLIRDFCKIMYGMENVMRELKNYVYLRKIFNIL